VLHYAYNTGVDSNISRLSSLIDNDNSTHLEDESYLGLDTIVKRAHPEPGIDLTYAKLSGESDNGGSGTGGGDQYTGLDRFGRVIDQRWTNSAGTSTTDRFQYGYDRDSNVLYKDNLVNSSF